MRKIAFVFLILFGFGFASLGWGQTAAGKRPMTFEDMMKMKRLGETAVSPDGKWLAYSVTTVNLEQNTKTTELWVQAIAGGEPIKLAVAQAGDGGAQFAPDGKRILFLSSREGGQQVWLADFDAATGATSNAKKLTAIATEADNAKWSPDGKSIVFTSAVYPDCPAITAADFDTGRQVQCGSRCGAGGEQGEGADFYASALSALEPLHGGQAVASVSGFGGRRGDAGFDAERCARCAADYPRRIPWLRLQLCAGLEGAGVYGESRSGAGDLDQCGYFHAGSD